MLELKKEIPLQVIPCSADLELFNPDAINEPQRTAVKTKFGIKETDTVIAYLGSVGGLYLTDEMMHFCKFAEHKIPHVKSLSISVSGDNDLADAAKSFTISL